MSGRPTDGRRRRPQSHRSGWPKANAEGNGEAVDVAGTVLFGKGNTSMLGWIKQGSP